MYECPYMHTSDSILPPSHSCNKHMLWDYSRLEASMQNNDWTSRQNITEQNQTKTILYSLPLLENVSACLISLLPKWWRISRSHLLLTFSPLWHGYTFVLWSYYFWFWCILTLCTCFLQLPILTNSLGQFIRRQNTLLEGLNGLAFGRKNQNTSYEGYLVQSTFLNRTSYPSVQRNKV